MAVVIPITSPRKFTSGPPELPGLMTASVWMNLAGCVEHNERFFALTMPALTVCSSSSGQPIVKTQSQQIETPPLAVVLRLQACNNEVCLPPEHHTLRIHHPE